MLSVAVIGSGAAASGVLAGLERFGPSAMAVTMFDLGGAVYPVPAGITDGRLSNSGISSIYRQLRSQTGSGFPPPKTHFGQSLAKHEVDGKPVLWKSEHHGGLTNFWGGGMLPFTEREFAKWPLSADEMDPHYRIVAEKVGICGEVDELNTYFPSDYVNRPPLRTSPVINSLKDTINQNSVGQGHYQMLAGASRLALETRPGHANGCVYSGECMLGCPRESIWNARKDIDRHRMSGLIDESRRARVRYFKDRHVFFQDPDDEASALQSAGPFDRIFIAAGCIGSTEIVMRSLGLEKGPRMRDTSIFTFPVFYLGTTGGLTGGGAPYFSLCNLTILGVPADPAQISAQVSIYPAFDHLWRFYTPEPLWGSVHQLARLGRWRLMLGRVYLGGDCDRQLSFELQDDKLRIRRALEPDTSARYKSFMDSLRRAANHAAFHIPSLKPIGHGTSSHYGCTLPYGGDSVVVASNGRIAPGVYLSDASTFPDLPAISPTFTIMANACRTVCQSLQE